MKEVHQPTNNWWTGCSLIAAILMCIGSIGIVILHWPPQLSMKWLITGFVFGGSAVGVLVYSVWFLRPRTLAFLVSPNEIVIRDQTFLRLREYKFDPQDVTRIHRGGDSPTVLMLRTGRTLILSDTLIMRWNEISQQLAEYCPHVKLTKE